MTGNRRLTRAALLSLYLYKERAWQRGKRYFEAIALSGTIKTTMNGSTLLIDYKFCKERKTNHRKIEHVSESLSLTYRRKKRGQRPPAHRIMNVALMFLKCPSIAQIYVFQRLTLFLTTSCMYMIYFLFLYTLLFSLKF